MRSIETFYDCSDDEDEIDTALFIDDCDDEDLELGSVICLYIQLACVTVFAIWVAFSVLQ